MAVLKFKNPVFTSAVLIAVPLFIFAGTRLLQDKYAKLPVYNIAQYNTGEDATHIIQAFSFYNQDGKVFSDKNVAGKIYVADFFFTGCMSVCPAMTANLKLIQDAFKDDPAIAIISFTVDPERDTAQKLKWYAGLFKINTGNWNLLTGSKQEIYRLARKSFYISAGDGDGGPNDFIHSDKLVLVDKHKQIRGYYTGTDKVAVDQLIHDIKKLENEK